MFSGQIQRMLFETAWSIKCQLAGQNTGKKHFLLNSSVMIWEERLSGARSASLQCQRAEQGLPWQTPHVIPQNMQCFCASASKLLLELNIFPSCPPHYLFSGKFFRARGSIVRTHVVGSPWQQPAALPAALPLPLLRDTRQGDKAG